MDTHFDNVARTMDFNMGRYVNVLRDTPDREDWITPAAVVNAFYSPTHNSICKFPQAIYLGIGSIPQKCPYHLLTLDSLQPSQPAFFSLHSLETDTLGKGLTCLSPSGLPWHVVHCSVDTPSYLNYGAIGVVMGHEITHGFDDQGAQYDGEGNIESWWTEEDQAAFDEHAQCFIDQYSAYTVDEITTPGVDNHVSWRLEEEEEEEEEVHTV